MSESSNIRILPESRRVEWDAYIEEHELSIAWQRYEWHEILKNHHRHEYYPLIAEKDGKICGIFPLYRLQSRPYAGTFLSVPFAVAGGIAADSPDIERELVTGALDLAKKHGVSSITLKQYKHKIEGDFFTDDNFYNRELSINREPGQLWNELAGENREMILLGKESVLSLEYPSLDIGKFYRLLSSYSHAQGVPCVSKRWIRDLVRSGMYSCAVVRQKGKAIAGTLVKCFKKTVSLPFTAFGGGAHADDRVAFWLYWELISIHAAKGYEIFHSGRIPNNESVPNFRLGWGGTKHPYFYQYYPNVSRATEFSQKRGTKRRLFSKLWRILPRPAAALLSPYLVRRFP